MMSMISPVRKNAVKKRSVKVSDRVSDKRPRLSKRLKKSLDDMLVFKHCSFEEGFDNMMSAALEYEHLKRNHKKIPKRVIDALDEAAKWRDSLSTEDWYRLIG